MEIGLGGWVKQGGRRRTPQAEAVVDQPNKPTENGS